MEIPEFCIKRPTTRQTRKRKTEQETDPDFIPETVKPSTSSTADKPVKEGGKRVRRSKQLEDCRKKPPSGLSFIERKEYSVENWKEKATESKKRAKTKTGTGVLTKTVKAMASSLREVDIGENQTLEYIIEKFEPFASSDIVQRFRDVVDNSEDEGDKKKINFNFDNLPKFVMGTGKGTEGGPPELEYNSLWNYDLDPLTEELDEEEGAEKRKFPYERDSSVPDVAPEVQSVAASFTVGCELNLKAIAEQLNNVELNPDSFAPLIMRIRRPKCTGLIFRTGKVIINGARSEEQCRTAARKFARMIQKTGYKVTVLNFEIQNILATCTLKFRVRLNPLSENKLYGHLSYEPEIFPGLLIPFEYPKVKIIVFYSGSVLMTGAKSMEDINVAFNKVYALLRMYAP